MNREFKDMLGFARHAEQLRVRERLADIAARGAVVQRMVVEAQSMLGKPSNFAPLAPSTVRDRVRHGYAPYETLLRTGDYRRSFSWAHTGARESGMGSSSPYAIYHELGGKVPGHPPQRSVIATPAQKKNIVLFELYGKTYRLTLPL